MSLSALTIYERLNARAKIRHMRALIALNDLGTMSRAAKALNISQPAMSQLVVELEKLIEAQLFLRHAKGVDPTPVTRDLVPIARRIITATQEGSEHIASHQRNDDGLVRVASTAAGSGALLDVILPIFAETHPNIQIQIKTVLGSAVGSSLAAAFSVDEYDIICCRQREVVPEGWEFSNCFLDELIPVCGAKHPFANRKKVTMQDLGLATWLQYPLSSLARQHFDNLVIREGWKDIKQIQVMSRVPHLTWTMLRSGEYLTLVPRSVVAPWLAEKVACELDVGLKLELSPVGYYWRSKLAGSATRKFASAFSNVKSIK